MRLAVVTGIVGNNSIFFISFLLLSIIVDKSSAFAAHSSSSPSLLSLVTPSTTTTATTTALSAAVPSSSADDDDEGEETKIKTMTSTITFEDIAKYPGRAFLSRAGAPTKIEFGPSSSSSDNNDNDNETSLIYLGSDGNTLTQKLWKRTISSVALNDVDEVKNNENDDGDIITELATPPAGVGEEDTLSAEEKLRRERTRQLETGITNFEYSKGGTNKVLLCPIGNDLFIKRDSDSDGEDSEKLIQIVDSSTLPGSVIDPHISNDGTFVVFVCENELYMASTTTKTTTATTTTSAIQDPIQLTFDATTDREGIANGVADFIAMEEMERNEGFWISPSSNLLAFEQSDESHIPKFKIMHSGQNDPSRQEDHRYPFAGKRNPKAKVGIIDLQRQNHDQGVVRWLDIESIFGDDMYLARVQWGTSGDNDNDVDDVVKQYLYVQIMNREQTELVLLRFDLSSSSTTDDDELLKGEELLREKAPPRSWINLHDNLIPLKDGNNGFIWASERLGGFRHLYRYSYDDKKQLRCYPLTLSSDDTQNEWMVETCTPNMVDEINKKIYFTGTKDSPKESHLYSTSLEDTMKPINNNNENDEGRIIDRITPGSDTDSSGGGGGMHSVLAIDMEKQLFIDSWSSTTQPHQVAVRSLAKDGKVVRLLHDGKKKIAEDESSENKHIQELAASLQPPEWFDVVSETTSTNDNKYSHLQQKMYGAIYKPDATIYGDGPYPTIVSVYGGPHAQMVTDSYGMTADLRAQRLRSQGYAVIKLDNRGSARRGLNFEIPIYHDMGNLEVDDQVTAVKHWIEKGVVDPKRVGMYGWSYGGYMSGMCLSKRPDIFKVAVAGAMVSSWDGYDTCYTERYMGTPQSNPIGYAKSDVMPYAKDITGSLLLVHGLIDENVHFRHTARFVNSLIKARIFYELLLFPDERHVPRGIEDKIYMEERISSFIERSL